MTANMNGHSEAVIDRLRERGLYISTAESCTGGLLAALITDVAGSSDVFCESVVTYSNEAKMRQLGVKPETLERYGAVSRDTAEEMAFGICRLTGADIGVGITGIAGPGGGTDKKPVGTVYVGINICGSIEVYHLLIDGTRAQVREETCRFVLKKLLEKI